VRLINTLSLWTSALSLTGWSEFEIRDLLDEDYYLGIPELLDGCQFTTRKENCEEFLELLVTGWLREGTADRISIHPGEWARYIQGDFRTPSAWSLKKLLGEVGQVLSQKSTPGSWPEDEELRLTTGVDFQNP